MKWSFLPSVGARPAGAAGWAEGHQWGARPAGLTCKSWGDTLSAWPRGVGPLALGWVLGLQAQIQGGGEAKAVVTEVSSVPSGHPPVHFPHSAQAMQAAPQRQG